METRYSLLLFDYKLDNYDDNDANSNELIELLRTDTYRNKSIRISKSALLIRTFEDENHYYDAPKYHIDNAITELIQKKIFCYDDIKDLNYYCLPVKLEDIENELIDFQNEIKYLEDLKK